MWWTLAACTDAMRVEETPLADLVLGRAFLVWTPRGSAVELTCTTPTDRDEVHELRSDPAPSHAMTVVGLLADTDYDCTFRAGHDTVSWPLRTDPLPEWLPSWTLEADDGAGGDYTLLNHGLDTDEPDREAKLLIVDREGRLRWYFRSPWDASDLDAQYLGDGEILYGGGFAAPPTIIGPLGYPVAEAGASSSGEPYHHHVEQLPSGEVVTLTEEATGNAEETWRGFAIDELDGALERRLWTWQSAQGLADGWLPYLPGQPDPWHANALIFDGDDVYINLRQLGWLVKLDKATGERRWTFGPGQDFALVDADGAAAPYEDWFWRAHAPEKHGDRFLMYDNGVGRPGGYWSRVAEFAIDEDARTARVVWEFTEPGWYEPIWGDVDRLPDGHVLVMRGHCEHCVETLPEFADERTQVMEIDPAQDRVVWRLKYTRAVDGGYRAARLDGCSIFANRKYCVSGAASGR